MPEEIINDERVVHGVLMSVFDRGVFILGESGTGKSELALELIDRGHRLVADDAICLRRDEDTVRGTAPELTSGLLAIRGLGLIDVVKVFGTFTLLKESKVDLCVELVWESDERAGDHLAQDHPVYSLFDVPVPLARFDVTHRPARPVYVETAVRMLKSDAQMAAARELAARHDAFLKSEEAPALKKQNSA